MASSFFSLFVLLFQLKPLERMLLNNCYLILVGFAAFATSINACDKSFLSKVKFSCPYPPRKGISIPLLQQQEQSKQQRKQAMHEREHPFLHKTLQQLCAPRFAAPISERKSMESTL